MLPCLASALLWLAPLARLWGGLLATCGWMDRQGVRAVRGKRRTLSYQQERLRACRCLHDRVCLLKAYVMVIPIAGKLAGIPVMCSGCPAPRLQQLVGTSGCAFAASAGQDSALYLTATQHCSLGLAVALW